MLQEIRLEAPAKVNLTLDVRGKRSDGYHELETVMHQVDLIDVIHLKAKSRGITVQSNNPLIPSGEDNLAYRAAAIMIDAGKMGVDIQIEKRIPVGAGLAGGSTDAAAVIIGLNRLYDLKLDQETLLDKGAIIGSDVPFCMTGGTALARGRGDILTPLSSNIKLEMLLVKPGFEISTAAVYKALDLADTELHPNTMAFIEAWNKCDIIDIARQLGNVLETVSIEKYPILENIRQEMLDRGALGAVMSGSGPTMVGVFPDHQTAGAADAWFKRRYPEVYLVSSYDRGD